MFFRRKKNEVHLQGVNHKNHNKCYCNKFIANISPSSGAIFNEQ